ncbi:hypothetical protein GW17_00015015 [Ensete ventricosum]|nr:hypothetical protein GW17_00015015 [Ensete ventricosum]
MGIRPSKLLWSLVERPPTIIPKMMQRAKHFITVETLIVEKREEQKHPRMKQPQGPTLGPSRRRIEGPDFSRSRPPTTLLNSTRTEIFLQIRGKGLLAPPNCIKTHPEERDQGRYCCFHREYDHDTKECRDLKNQIEDLIRQGHLDHYVQRRGDHPDRRSERDRQPRPADPVERHIDVIVGRPTADGDSASAHKKPIFCFDFRCACDAPVEVSQQWYQSQAKGVKRRGGQPRPAPMQGRPPTARPRPRPPAIGRLVTTRASLKGRPVLPARGDAYGQKHHPRGQQPPTSTTVCGQLAEGQRSQRRRLRARRRPQGRLPAGKGSRRLCKGSSGGSAAEGKEGLAHPLEKRMILPL